MATVGGFYLCDVMKIRWNIEQIFSINKHRLQSIVGPIMDRGSQAPIGKLHHPTMGTGNPFALFY